MKFTRIRRCSLCSAQILGAERPAATGALDICLICLLAAEEAREAIEDRFTLGPRPPSEPDGGRYSVCTRSAVNSLALEHGPDAVTQYESSFPRLEHSPVRWF